MSRQGLSITKPDYTKEWTLPSPSVCEFHITQGCDFSADLWISKFFMLSILSFSMLNIPYILVYKSTLHIRQPPKFYLKSRI